MRRTRWHASRCAGALRCRQRTTDQIPLDSLIDSAVVVDVSAAGAANADYQVSVTDFTRWKASHGAIEPDIRVMTQVGVGGIAALRHTVDSLNGEMSE